MTVTVEDGVVMIDGYEIENEDVGKHFETLKEQGKDPKYLAYANFRIPHNMCDFMAGGAPSIEAAKETLEYIKIIGILIFLPNLFFLVY